MTFFLPSSSWLLNLTFKENDKTFKFVRHVSTKTSVISNYFSLTSYSYKVGLIRTLVDTAYKINNTWLGLHEDITKLMEILKKESFLCPFD